MAARSAVVLAPPADRLVHALKYGGWPGLGEEMAEFMAEAARDFPDPAEAPLIVPVPTTPGRLRRRGYNQAQLLAQRLGEHWSGTVIEVLERKEEAVSQVALDPGERLANVAQAFSLGSGAESVIRGRRMVLVDDVLTTGATASAAAMTLEAGGAVTVQLLTFARSLPDFR